uniref:Uncharacterized protein n=1 Tax=Tetraodon nigroviridis TaxID=99883 RepID=H3CJB3_TETNG
KGIVLSNKQNAVCKEEQAEESSQSKGIWSIPSLIDYLASASDSSRFCEGAKSAESSSESVCPTLVPAGLEATVPHSNTPPEEVPSMESCQSEDIWFTPPSHIENEVPSMESCQSQDIWFTPPSHIENEVPSMESCRSQDIWFTPPSHTENDREEDSLPMKAFHQTE